MRNVLGILIISFAILSGCQSGISFSPDFHIHSSEIQAIISERNDIIYCNEEKFEEYASMHKEKIKELAEILRRARLPKEYEQTRRKILQELKSIEKRSNI